MSVETHWFPLTPEHGFPSLLSTKHKALPLHSPGQIRESILHFLSKKINSIIDSDT